MNLAINYKETKEIIPYINNSRTHSESQVQQVASSIKEFGFTNPILIDQDGGIIAGHGRLLAAQLLNLKTVPTITIEGLTEFQKKAYVIADNKLAMNSGWNEELLRLEIEALQEIDFNINVIGFDDGELATLFLDIEEGGTNAEEEWDNMPEFDQPDDTSFRRIIVHFDTPEDVAEFCSLIGQPDTGKTKSIWYPQKERNDYEAMRYK